MTEPSLLACPECDLLHRACAAPGGTTQLCTRCGAHLGQGGAPALAGVLAWLVTALILCVLALTFPLLDLTLRGTPRETSIAGCVQILLTLGWPGLAAILLTTVILAPLFHLSGMILVLLQVVLGRTRSWTARLFRVLEEFRRWGMVEVFLLGVLVSYAKVARMAQVVPGPALFALAGCILAMAVAGSRLEARTVWAALGSGSEPGGGPSRRSGSARRERLQACPACALVTGLDRTTPCPRCGAALYSRKPDPYGRTWALLITSVLLYLPANLLPVTRVVSLGRVQEDTILSGVNYLLRTGSWPLALVIFVASVLVPMAKFVILTLLLLSVRARSRWRPRLRTVLYRLTENVGRWSMVDIFAISLMVAMVQAGSLASVAPRPGAMAFALMVAATILAVRCFDPRLVWDVLEPDHG